jgi:hypothetical protein
VRTDAPYKDKVEKKHADRWAYGHADIAAAAYVLDPEFISHDHASNEEVMTGFYNVAIKIGILKSVRARLSDFADAWKERCKYIGNDPTKLTSYEAFPHYPTKNDQDVRTFCSAVNNQLAIYRGKKGVFANQFLFDSAREQPAYLWWEQNGASAAELKYMAQLILSQPASASICERINSEFAFIKDQRRNRLEHKRANKLVALFHNLRLLARTKKPDYTEPAIGWNDEDFAVGVTKYGVAHYDGTSALKVKAPAMRPALPPPPAHNEGEECQLLALM